MGQCPHCKKEVSMGDICGRGHDISEFYPEEKAEPEPMSRITPEELAQMFHETYEGMAPLFGYETRRGSAKPWEQVPKPNRNLMIAVAEDVLRKLALLEAEPEPTVLKEEFDQLHIDFIERGREIDRLTSKNEVLKQLLKVAICPGCDGSGGIPTFINREGLRSLSRRIDEALKEIKE